MPVLVIGMETAVPPYKVILLHPYKNKWFPCTKNPAGSRACGWGKETPRTRTATGTPKLSLQR
jgi:hypothetical protein